MAMDDPKVFAATLVHAGAGEGDELLQGFVAEQVAAGWRLEGLLAVARPEPRRCASMQLRDLRSGELYPIAQALGPGSQSCSLDAAGLAAASIVLRRALKVRPALVVVNRFGGQEAQGKGFAPEMLALMEAGIPLLTLTRATQLDDWRRFTGGLGQELMLEGEALRTWFAQAVAACGGQRG